MSETNYEHYKEEIIDLINTAWQERAMCTFAKKHLHNGNCKDMLCTECKEAVAKWLKAEYRVEIDWERVPVDTPVYVSDIIKTPSASTGDKCRHLKEFRKEQDRPFVCFNYGKSSFTCCADDGITSWTYCTLARPEDVEKYKKV